MHQAAPVCSLLDQGCIARCQRCSQGARLRSAGKHPLPIALQRHIIIVTTVYDIRQRSTARHFQALALAAPDAERKRTCVSVSGKILAVSCGSPTDGSWRGTLLSNHRADGETRVRRDHKASARLGEADAGSSRCSRPLSGARVYYDITRRSLVSDNTSNYCLQRVRCLHLRSQSFVPDSRPTQASTAAAAYSISRNGHLELTRRRCVPSVWYWHSGRSLYPKWICSDRSLAGLGCDDR